MLWSCFKSFLNEYVIFCEINSTSKLIKKFRLLLIRQTLLFLFYWKLQNKERSTTVLLPAQCQKKEIICLKSTHINNVLFSKASHFWKLLVPKKRPALSKNLFLFQIKKKSITSRLLQKKTDLPESRLVRVWTVTFISRNVCSSLNSEINIALQGLHRVKEKKIMEIIEDRNKFNKNKTNLVSSLEVYFGIVTWIATNKRLKILGYKCLAHFGWQWIIVEVATFDPAHCCDNQ